jgi:lipid A disaccharide synthetase
MVVLFKNPLVLGYQSVVLSFYLITDLALISYFKLQNLFISYLFHMNSKFSGSNCKMFTRLFSVQIKYSQL